MAIEQGLVLLIQAGLGTPPMAPGGFAVKLPKDQISSTNPKAWTYRSIEAQPSYYLSGQDGLTELHWQIDCHGSAMADAITLARAIDGVLRGGYQGALPDTDHTIVQGVFRTDPFLDGFSDVNRSYVRTLQYQINYEQV